MQVSVLGATEVWRDDERVELGTRKRRALVAALALHAGRPVSVDGLVDLLWGDSPPDGVAGTLQVYVSGLRRAMRPAICFTATRPLGVLNSIMLLSLAKGARESRASRKSPGA